MIGVFECSLIAKKEPNRDKGKTKFQYGLIVTQENFREVCKSGKVLSDFSYVSFWSDVDIPPEFGKKCLCRLDVIDKDTVIFKEVVQVLDV